MIKFNKGEWSELYVFLKILSDARIIWADQNVDTNNLDDFIEINAIRHNNKNNVVYRLDGNNVVLETLEESKVLHCYREFLFHSFIPLFFKELTTRKGRSFDIPIVDKIITDLKIGKFKGTSQEKHDVNVDFYYGNLLYSNDPIGIKSFIGGNPTLLNASLATNFTYKIVNFNGDSSAIDSINAAKRIGDRIRQIEKHGGELVFTKCKNQHFEQNLKIIDSNMDSLLAQILLSYYKGHGSKLAELIENKFDIIKIKRFLRSILLGMFPSKEWDGENQSHGVVVAKQNGDLALYHILRENILNQYLFLHTKLDTPSTSRHRFGFVYAHNQELYFDLNLQIRHI